MADRQGAVGPMVAVLAMSLLLAGGLALDVGLYRLGNRDLRAATEAAALAAAMDPSQAEARARDYLVRNGYDPSVLQQVTVGRYCADIDTPADQRFDPTLSRCPGAGTTNAVRLRTGKPSRRFLTGALGDEVAIPDLGATATATRIDEAGVSITSGLLTVNNALVSAVNDLLGALIGVKLRLSTSDIEALMGGNVDAGRFFDALARRAGQTGTYGRLVQGTYSLQDIAGAAADAASTPRTAAVLRLFAAQIGSGYRVPLTGMFGLGVWKNMPVGEAQVRPALGASLNAYQLVSFAAQAGPGAIDLSDAVSLVVPGSTARIAAVASGPMDRPRFSFGPAGETEVGTSALRLQINLGLGRIALLGNTVEVNQIPVLIDVAAARARVAAISCPSTAEQARDTAVTVTAQTGLVSAYIGVAPANAMTRPMPPITAAQITPARIIGTNLAGTDLITADLRVAVQPVLGNSGNLVFGPGGAGTIGSPSLAGRPASIGNGSQVGPTLNALVASLGSGLDVRLLGTPLPLGQVLGLVGAIAAPVTGLVGTAVDPLLDSVLAALGIQLGHATVWVTGARCGVPVLV